MNFTSCRFLILLLPVVLAACGTTASAPDAGGSDAGSDAGPAEDAFMHIDSGPTDGDVTQDAQTTPDGSVDPDGSVEPDASMDPDGSVEPDGGLGADAGYEVDAGAVTTCSLAIAPLVGTEDDDFVFTPTTNGTGCTGGLVGGPSIAVSCEDPVTFPGSTFGTGMHTAMLSVADGPGGATSCTASFEVISVSTTCSIEVSPSSGTTSDTFTATLASNGFACSGSVNGVSVGTVDCTGTFAGMGSLLGPGTHTATLHVDDGPSGPTECSAIFMVTP
jgi:hypothetical protein